MSDQVPVTAQAAPIEVQVEEGKAYWWCSCGRSAKQPFCDGSHKGSAFAPVKFTAAESGSVWLCACKRTQDRPFCDGSHDGL